MAKKAFFSLGVSLDEAPQLEPYFAVLAYRLGKKHPPPVRNRLPKFRAFATSDTPSAILATRLNRVLREAGPGHPPGDQAGSPAVGI